MSTLSIITTTMNDGKLYTTEDLSRYTGLSEFEIGRCLEDHPLNFPISYYELDSSFPNSHSCYYKLIHHLL